jgi:hypothetical protein
MLTDLFGQVLSSNVDSVNSLDSMDSVDSVNSLNSPGAPGYTLSVSLLSLRLLYSLPYWHAIISTPNISIASKQASVTSP